MQSNTKAMNIDDCLNKYINGDGKNRGRQQEERYTSFDYCFNYFQQFRDDGNTSMLADVTHMESSCLHLAFYLASWGMFRGASFLLSKSVKFFEPLIKGIAESDQRIWQIDADQYTDENIHMLLEFGGRLSEWLGKDNRPSDTLITKTMLGVFGNVPAFDRNFRTGFGCYTFGAKSLKMIGRFYRENQEQIDSRIVYTLNFNGQVTTRRYTKAKLIDMIGFIGGAEQASDSKH